MTDPHPPSILLVTTLLRQKHRKLASPIAASGWHYKMLMRPSAGAAAVAAGVGMAVVMMMIVVVDGGIMGRLPYSTGWQYEDYQRWLLIVALCLKPSCGHDYYHAGVLVIPLLPDSMQLLRLELVR